jgi:thiamine-phosphate pyrophosphorylase
MITQALRIIDANANRAREGLRVLEDLARFGMDHAGLSKAFKQLRHDLASLLTEAPWGPDAILHRDTPGDVGTSISTPSESSRETLASVADSNAGRVQEALRSIEEASKLAGAPMVARGVESLRYRAYSAHQQLILCLGAGNRRTQWALCVLLTESLCTQGLPWRVVAQRALDGGADAIQLREKHLADRELKDRASWLAALCRERGRALIVNDRPDIAMLAHAHGVHLGQSDLSPLDARKLVGFSLLIGVSTETMEEAHAAVDAGADLCGVGPMFATTTKAKPRLAGPAQLARYTRDAKASRVPHLAIGGIKPENIVELVAAGCRGVAVSGAVCGVPDPQEACATIRAALGAAPMPDSAGTLPA